jgi:hypothetical protein
MKIVQFFATALLTITIARAQDHGHLNVGTASQSQGSKLIWQNGGDFESNSSYVKTLLPVTTGRTAGFYDGNITLTSLHSTNAFGEPIANAPAPGAFIVGEIVSVEGPEGGAFGFWETNSPAGSPKYSISSGTTNATARFEISDSVLGAGSPGGDPYGHIHGRRLTLSKPGIYTIGFRVYDISTNGPGGSPIHQPSDVLKITFQAGYNIQKIEPFPGLTMITVGMMAGQNFTLQYSTNLTDTNAWTDIEEMAGADVFGMIHDMEATNSFRFYRVKVTAP